MRSALKWMSWSMLTSVALLLAVAAFAAVAAPVDPGTDPLGFLGQVWAAVQGKQWAVVAGLVVLAVVYVVRTYGARFLPFLATDRGGVISAIVVGILGDAALVLLTSGSVFNWRTIVDGVLLGVFSSGMYSQIKKLLFPAP